MNDRFATRLENLRRALHAEPAGLLIVSSETNVRYLTGFTGDSTHLVVTPDRAIAVSDFRYEEQLSRECPGLEVFVRPMTRKLWGATADLVMILGTGPVAFEASATLVSDQLFLRECLPSAELAGLSGLVESLRAIKDSQEIESIRQAVRAAERAFRMLRDGLNPDESELDAADLLESYLKRCGSTRPAFDPIVAGGANSALPHATAQADRRIRESDFLLVDWGGTVGGYRSDLTRVIATGNVGPDFERHYRAVLEAQEGAIAAIRPGVRASEVDAVARTALDRHGLASLFGHGLGHGLGLCVHELPSLRPESEDLLRPGMVVTVEPGIYRPGWGGIRIEDDVLVTEAGHEVLTRLPKSFESIPLG